MSHIHQNRARREADDPPLEHNTSRGFRGFINRITGKKKHLVTAPVAVAVAEQQIRQSSVLDHRRAHLISGETTEIDSQNRVASSLTDQEQCVAVAGSVIGLNTEVHKDDVLPALCDSPAVHQQSRASPLVNNPTASTSQLGDEPISASASETSTDFEHGPSRRPVKNETSEDTPGLSLWDRAYNALQESHPDLVKEYDSLLEKELKKYHPDSKAVKTYINISEPSVNDQLAQNRQFARKSQLDTMIARGLNGFDPEKKPNRDFIPREKIDQAAKLAIAVKEFIEQAVKGSPEASMAWAGVCIILPLLTNPTIADEANKDGFVIVASRMSFWSAMERQILRHGGGSSTSPALMAEVENHFVTLYRHMLEFQIRTVLRFHRQGWKRYLEDVCSPVIWTEIIEAITKQESIFNRDLQNIHNINTSAKHSLAMADQNKSSMGLQSIIRDVAEDIHKLVTEKEKECLQLFRLTKNSKDVTYEWYKSRVEDRVANTCKWVLQHQNFQTWLAAESGPLLISADPGCGKSVLSKYLVDGFFPEAPSTSSAAVCYFFFKDGDQNSARQALCALLHQLFSQRRHLVKHAMKQCEEDGRGIINSTDSLWKVLAQAVQDKDAGPIILVLDAMDECIEIECRDLLRRVSNLFRSNWPYSSGPGRLKILLTSRPYDHIVDEFHALTNWLPYVRIPGEASSDMISEEINHVIRVRVEQFASKQKLRPNVKEALQDQLLAIEHRTYLWIYLVFDYLEDANLKKTPKGVVDAMKNLPRNVNEAYERILSRSRDQAMARKALYIILAAYRPLTVSEMNIAVNIDPTLESLEELDEDDVDFEKRLRSSCGLFISVHHGNVYFLHQTAREFLLSATNADDQPKRSDQPVWKNTFRMPEAHHELLSCCVVYMKLTDGDGSLLKGPDGVTNRDLFWDYSALHWLRHLEDAGDIPCDGVVGRLLPRCKVHSEGLAATSNMVRIFEEWRSLCKYDSPLQVASNCNSETTVTWLLRLDHLDVERERDDGRWPSIQLAIMAGYLNSPGHEYKVLKNLLNTFPHAAEELGMNPFPYIERACVPFDTAKLRPPSQPALILLVSHGLLKNTSTRKELGVRLLQSAIHSNIPGNVSLLLDNGLQELINSFTLQPYSTVWHTPLMCAVWYRRTLIITLLLDRGANIELGTSRGETPLQLVSRYNSGHPIARLLVDRGADIDAVDDASRTPLHMAAIHRRKSIVQLLLDRGAQTELADYIGETALYLAASKGHSGIVRMLLEAGARWEVTQAQGLTPLKTAARNGHVDVMKLLLDHGANIQDILDDFGVILSASVKEWMLASESKGDLRRLSPLTTIRWLLEQAASVRAKDTTTETLLNQVVWNDETAIADLVHDYSLNLENGFAKRKPIFKGLGGSNGVRRKKSRQYKKQLKNFERRVVGKYEAIFQLLAEHGIDLEELEWKKYGVVVPISWLFGEEGE
ncbi:putative ankyrin repeat protein [Copromyces sp. CBS 386.78]|nr:putative ankyrin repeat protein [Copromyces sp. CBS 386.78]